MKNQSIADLLFLFFHDYHDQPSAPRPLLFNSVFEQINNKLIKIFSNYYIQSVPSGHLAEKVQFFN